VRHTPDVAEIVKFEKTNFPADSGRGVSAYGVGRAGAVPNTVQDIMDGLKNPDLAQKCVLLTDCTAVASDWEPLLRQVIEQIQKAGLRAVQSSELSL
jgi:hypothetical protein